MTDTTDQIKQINARYDGLEDRILLSITTEQNRLLEAWLSRRFLKLLIPALQGKHPLENKPLLSDTQQAIQEMQQLQAQQESDFDTTFDIPAEPIKVFDKPILITQLTLKDMDSDHPQLLLLPQTGEGLVFNFHPNITGNLLKLLEAIHPQTEWGLEFPQYATPTNIQ